MVLRALYTWRGFWIRWVPRSRRSLSFLLPQLGLSAIRSLQEWIILWLWLEWFDRFQGGRCLGVKGFTIRLLFLPGKGVIFVAAAATHLSAGVFPDLWRTPLALGLPTSGGWGVFAVPSSAPLGVVRDGGASFSRSSVYYLELVPDPFL